MEKKKKIVILVGVIIAIIIIGIVAGICYQKNQYEKDLALAKEQYSDNQKKCNVVGTTLNYVAITRENKESEKVKGAKWKVTTPDGKEVGTFETDEDGAGGLVGLDYGEYYLEEVSVPEGNAKIEEKYKVGITSYDKAFNFFVSPKENDGKLLLVLTDEEDNPIPNQSYDFLDSNGEVIKTITTNENGLAGLVNLDEKMYFVRESGKEDATATMIMMERPNIARINLTK